MQNLKDWLLIFAMAVFAVLLIYMGDFLGCYQMITFSTSCDWFIDIENIL